MKLRLISPDGEFEYDYWQDDTPPAVVVVNNEIGLNQRVWVKGSNSTQDNQMYFEQGGVIEVYGPEVKKVK